MTVLCPYCAAELEADRPGKRSCPKCVTQMDVTAQAIDGEKFLIPVPLTVGPRGRAAMCPPRKRGLAKTTIIITLIVLGTLVVVSLALQLLGAIL